MQKRQMPAALRRSVAPSGERGASVIGGVAPSHPRTRIAMPLILLLATALRLFRLDAQSLWIDEWFTLQTLSNPPDGLVASAMRINNAPPLYFGMAWPMVWLFGANEWSLRLPSALAGIVALLLMHRLARRLFHDERAGFAAALLLAVNPLHVWYSQEARNYTLVLTLMLGACVAYLRAVERGRTRDWALLAGVVVAVAATSTQGLVVLPVLLSWALLAPPPGPRRRGLAIGLGVAGVLAASIAAVVLLRSGRPPPPRPFSVAAIGYTLYCYTVGYSFGPSTLELQTQPLRQVVAANLPQLALGCLLSAATCLAWVRVGWRKAAPALSWLAAGIGFGLAIQIATPHSYHVRYALPGLLGFVLLTARAATRPHRWALGLLVAHVVVALWSDVQWFAVPRYGKDDTRDAVALLRREAPSTDRILVAPYYMDALVAHYLAVDGTRMRVEPLRSPGQFDVGQAHTALLLTRPRHTDFLPRMEADLRDAVTAQGWHSATTRSYRVYWRN